MHKVIEPETIAKKADLSAPHTVHCLPTGEMMLSMLGDAKGDAPGGFLLLDDKYEVAGRWEKGAAGMNFNYDFWYQPKHDVMVSSEWAAPKTFQPGPSRAHYRKPEEPGCFYRRRRRSGPSRAHEVRYPGGDRTGDTFS